MSCELELEIERVALVRPGPRQHPDGVLRNAVTRKVGLREVGSLTQR